MGTLRANESATHAVDDAVVDSICDDFESTWKSGHQPRIEDYLTRAAVEERGNLLVELILVEYELRRSSGDTPTLEEYLLRFPDDAAFLKDRLLRELETAGLPQPPLLPADRGQLRPGDLWGRYQLLALLGRGGFGEVWRARDPLLNREVAIKTLRSDKPISERLNQELVREGQRVAQLNHENIVRVLHAEIVNGRAFLVSDLKEGGTLHDRLRDGRSVDREQAVRWMIDVALALQSAHEQGFVHRDLKPGNLLFDRKGNIAVADFGLAVTELDQLSEPSGMMGTWAYASPEQARGEARLADPRSDLYAFGVILYQLLTGRLPFQANTADQYKQQILEREPRPPRAINADIPIELETICLACLRKEIANRPASAREVADTLQTWLDRKPGSIPPDGHIQSHPRVSPISWIVAASIVTGAIVAFFISFLNRDSVYDANASREEVPPWATPVEKTWDIGDPDAPRPGYDSVLGQYEFDALGASMFQVGTCEHDELTLKARLHIRGNERLGKAGIYWAWDSVFNDPEIRACCFGVEVGRLSVDSEDELTISQHDINLIGSRYSAYTSASIVTIPVAKLRSSQFDLAVNVTSTHVMQVYLNGEAVLREPVELSHLHMRNWQRLKNTGYGFMGSLGSFSVIDFDAE